MHILKSALAALLVVLTLSVYNARQGTPRQPEIALPIQQGDYVAHNFKFGSGESLPELRLHYRTLGSRKRDAEGHVSNACSSCTALAEQAPNSWDRSLSACCSNPDSLAGLPPNCSRNRNQMQNNTAYNFFRKGQILSSLISLAVCFEKGTNP
jgi:hypothetical protein